MRLIACRHADWVSWVIGWLPQKHLPPDEEGGRGRGRIWSWIECSGFRVEG